MKESTEKTIMYIILATVVIGFLYMNKGSSMKEEIEYFVDDTFTLSCSGEDKYECAYNQDMIYKIGETVKGENKKMADARYKLNRAIDRANWEEFKDRPQRQKDIDALIFALESGIDPNYVMTQADALGILPEEIGL